MKNPYVHELRHEQAFLIYDEKDLKKFLSLQNWGHIEKYTRNYSFPIVISSINAWSTLGCQYYKKYKIIPFKDISIE